MPLRSTVISCTEHNYPLPDTVRMLSKHPLPLSGRQINNFSPPLHNVTNTLLHSPHVSWVEPSLSEGTLVEKQHKVVVVVTALLGPPFAPSLACQSKASAAEVALVLWGLFRRFECQ